MSLHYLLDGYNILHQIPGDLPGKLDDQRRFLIELIETRKPFGSSKNNVTIYFDGRPGRDGRIENTSVQVVFTESVSADDRIKEFVENALHKKNVVVITDDRDIQYSVRPKGAKVLKVKDFLSKLRSKPGRSKGKKESKSHSKYVSKTTESEINKELEGIWLTNKDD